MARALTTVLVGFGLAACSREARNLEAASPQTPPISDQDARIPAYQNNLYQVANGGRYFAWYGCLRCHAEGAAGWADLADHRWRHGGGFAKVYASIADVHRGLAYRSQIPADQLWQLTAYVRDLSLHHPEKRKRVALDQKAEPVGTRWSGPQ